MAGVPIIGQQHVGPKCPGCGVRPIVMDMHTGQWPTGAIAGLIHCHDCGYVLPAVLLGIAQPQVMPAAMMPKPRLV